jgi:hypothetical protein
MKFSFIRNRRYSFLISFIAIWLLNQGNVFAQYPASSYSFSALSGTYTDINGGTVVTALAADDGTGNVNIGFNFNFCGTIYTQLKACSNGWLCFGTTTTSNQWTNTYANLTSGPSMKPIMMPLWDDLGGTNGQAMYTTSGIAPNRIFTMQYNHWQWNVNTVNTTYGISFQVRLYETTNVIEYQYRQETGAFLGAPSATIGIADGATAPTFLSLDGTTASPNASATTFTTSIATKPATGQIYRFTPPIPCNLATGMPTSGTVAATPATICLSGNATLNFAPNVVMPAVTGITYKWQTCPTATGTYTDIPGAITTLPTYTTTVPITASAYFKCVVLCNATNIVLTSSASNQVVVNNPGNATAIPGSRCGPGSVALGATVPSISPTAVLNWYATATGGTSLGTGTTFNTAYLIANTTFYVSATANGCEGNRVAVLATVTTSAPVVHTSPAVVCNNSVATISLTPPATPYSSYNWSPASILYSDAAGTVPYTGGSANPIYMRTQAVGTQSIYLMAGNPLLTTGCTFADTIKIWVQPKDVVIRGNPDTICVSGNTVLSLDTITGYYPGSIQWQTSTNGTAYTNITGATSPTYTTPVLTYGQNTYYRSNISAGTAVCQSPVKYVVVANATLLSAPDSFNCGPGTVTLSAVTGGNGSAVWYTSPSGGIPIASGTPYVTPYLGATTSFYVASRGGGPSGNIQIGAGGSVSGVETVNPYASGWGGTKIQYIIRATELTAAGIPAGASLNAIALDVVGAAAVSYPGFAISMKNTTTTALTTSFEAGTSEVYAPNTAIPVNGINNYVFTTPFTWNGTSNLLVQMCWSNGTTNSAGTTVKMDNTSYVATHRGQKDSQTPSDMCGLTGTTATTNGTHSMRPKFIFAFSKICETPRQEVRAHIYPIPAVDLGPDVNKCIDEQTALVLNAGVQPNNAAFLWDDSTTSQVRSVTESGTYAVKVTNQFTCFNTDTINVILRPNPVIDLGNDTTVCNGVTLTLAPGGNGEGISYFWNTGQSQPQIQVNNAGSYNVFVTNNKGCTAADTIVITMEGELPTVQGIQVSNDAQFTFHFTAVNPQFVVGYDWDFGDSTAHSYQATPTHVYANSGNYTVVLRLSSTCGFVSDTLGAHIVGIHQINVSNEELSVYPNPTRNIATIAVSGDLKMEKVEVYNVLGQVVYRKKTDSASKHIMELNAFASGVYTVQVYTDKGTVSRKLEVVK